MSIFPFMDGSTTEVTLETLPTPREFAWDFNRNEFILENGKFRIVEGLEALKIWIWKALHTERYRFRAYSWEYGQEFEKLIGDSRATATVEARRYLEECLLVNPHIKQVKNVVATVTGDNMELSFTAVTDYGEVGMNV